jgi:hypothetical protein
MSATHPTSLVGRVTAKVLSWLRDDDGGNVWTDDDSRAWLDASDSYCHASDHLIFCQATAAIESVGSLLSFINMMISMHQEVVGEDEETKRVEVR